MTSRFDYLLTKIEEANFSSEPFKHIEINNFLNDKDFSEIITSKEINISKCNSDDEVFESLFSNGYKLIPFPGATTDHLEYVSNRKLKKTTQSHSATESSGAVLRLTDPSTNILIDLKEFIESDKFNLTLSKKFDLDFNKCKIDTGIQKYLDEYEISPHPDIRKKALTYMVNINNASDSELRDHHTHYLKFKADRSYVAEFWKGNPLIERCWVPWSWCETAKEQRQNNSIIIFSPSFDTMHAVKASYCHLDGQRTQIYGNHWYKEDIKLGFEPSSSRLDWWDFDFREAPVNSNSSLFSKSLRLIRKNFFTNNQSKIDKTRSDNY